MRIKRSESGCTLRHGDRWPKPRNRGNPGSNSKQRRLRFAGARAGLCIEGRTDNRTSGRDRQCGQLRVGWWRRRRCSPSTSIASITLSRLCAGSPMPMNTTLPTARRLRASTTCATISALPSWRRSPARPLMQNTQPTAQPTWVDTHRPSLGSSTLSTVCPSASFTSRRAEPSSPGCSDCTRARPCSSSKKASGCSACTGGAGPARDAPGGWSRTGSRRPAGTGA